MTYKKDYFEKRKTELETEIKALEKRSKSFSFLRLLLFTATAVAVFLEIYLKMPVLWAVAGVLFAAFIFLCVKHYKLSTKLKFKKTVNDINDCYIARFQGDFSKLTDKGNEFFVTDHDYCVDLDIFGESSLFALYNISESAFGRKRFADDLLHAHVSEDTNEDIRKRQNSVHELSEDVDFLQEYQARARLGKMQKMPEALINLAGNTPAFTSKTVLFTRLILLLWLIPVVLLFVNPKFCVPAAMVIIVLNLIISFALSSKFSEYFKAVEGISRQTDALSSLYLALENKDFKDPYLKELIAGKDTKVSDSLKVLANACAFSKIRMQPLLALVLNAFCLYDSVCADKLFSWARKYGPELGHNIESLAKIESMMSASVVEMVSEYSVRPEFIDCDRMSGDNAFFDGTNIVHPLLQRDKAVSNSIKIDKKIALITGSNMSGKTTLIRTIGVCSILSYIGASVPARNLTLGRMRIASSMRIVDNMKEEMSTFKAELVRISRIVEAGREGKPLLFLIDEIFRGTNSADRTSGAMTVLKILSREGIIGLMTTHDYALCDEAKETMANITYYHFSETYDDNGIYFDYKLKDGVSNISNAKYLMKLVGIII